MNVLSVKKICHPWVKFLLTIVIISSMVTSCNLPWQSTKTVSTRENDIQVKEATLEPTAEPRKDLPPALVEVSPIPGSTIALNKPISFYFNQPMDTGSVEAAIHFEPRVNGRFDWEDDQILNFIPDQNLAPGTDLNLVINTSAQASNKKSLLAPVEIDYQTADELLVAHIIPTDLALDVDPESLVFVSFNQPVVALGAEEAGPPAFSLTPEVQGEGKWLNTTTYIFTPETSMSGGTIYKIMLNQSLVATSGAEFESQELQFKFTTTTPQVIEVLPLASKNLSLDGPIEVKFNIRMESESVESNFTLRTANGSGVGGSFEWQEDNHGFKFTPDVSLDRNTRYVIEIGDGAQSYGGLTLDAPFEASRTTYPELNVTPSQAPEFRSYYGQYGQYEIQFTAPVTKENFKDYVSIVPEVASESLQLINGNTTLSLSGYFKPDTEHTLTLNSNLSDQWGGNLGQNFTYSFFTPPATPSLSVASGFTNYNLLFVPSDVSEIVLQATNINTVNFEIAPITVRDLLTLVHPDNYEYRRMFLPENLEVSTQNLELTRNINQAVRLPLSYQDNPLEPGVYFLGITSADLIENGEQVYEKYYLIVSDNHVTMKIAPEQAFVWATKLSDYSPLTNTPVTVYNSQGDLLTNGETDSDGFFISPIATAETPYTNFLTVLGEPGQENFAFSISTWGQGYALYERGIQQNTFPETIQAYIYTDRPIYRPGDTIHFKAVIFSRDNSIPVSSGLDQIDVAVYGDPGMSGLPVNLYSETHTLSSFGTIEGDVKIPQDASTGRFHIALTQDEKNIESLYFDVAAYRKPEIEIGLSLNTAGIVLGDNLSANFQADYYFGLPVADQPFIWTLYRGQTNFHLPGYQVGPINTDWLMPRIYELTELGEIVAYGEGATDDQGLEALTFSESDMGLDEMQAGSTQKLSLEVTVTDETGFPVSYRESALVHPDSFYIGVKPENYFGNANKPFSFTVLTVDWEKQPVGAIPLEAIFEAIEWEVEETQSIEMPYRYRTQTSIIDTANPITGDDGRTRIAFTPPEPGTYQLTLRSGDAVTQTLVWVAGEGSPAWPPRIQNLIDLKTDSDSYQVGQTAQVFFPNPLFGSAKALVTIERGQVMETRVVDVDSAGYNLNIPITEESIPNIYLSVMLLGKDENGNPAFRQGIQNINVSPVEKTLNVELLLDPTETAPGEQVSVTLIITDQQGNPVQGEFSVAVVDKALLALVEANSQPILKALYSTQPLAVQTAFSLKTYALQLALSAELGRGGGGDMEIPSTLREEFPDTALWEGQVVTAADGTAHLEIPLPDSLTTWVVDVRGLSGDFRVGQAEAEIITQKELMIRPVTPRFLVDGDHLEMAAVVHNNTLDTLEVEISLLGSGFRLDEGTDQNQTKVIAAGESQRVNWWGTVESRESIELIFQAVSGDLSDATKPVWGDLRVLRYAMPATFSTSGLLQEEGQVLELVSLPISVDPSSGSLSLELQPSLTASIVGGLEALNSPSFSDTISILSRMIANISTFQTLVELGISIPELEADLSTLVGDSLHELLDIQKFDGGWSWWGGSGNEYLSSDPFITAYVLMGLQEALDAGFDVGDYYIDQARQYLLEQMINPENIKEVWELDRLAFQVYVLRHSDSALSNEIDALYNRRSDLSPWSLAFFALALDQIDFSNQRLGTLLDDLEAAAVRTETGVHWESHQVSWMLPGTPIFNTSVGVYALAQLDPASSSLSPALRYLMSHQDAKDSTRSSFESTWLLMAMTAALKGTGDYQADYTFQALLNDRLFAEGIADGTSSPNTVKTTVPILDLYPDAPNALSIQRDQGPGTLYYRLDLQTYQPAADAKPIDKGINLEREYYLVSEVCPGLDDCTPIDSLTLDPNDPGQMILVSLTITLKNDVLNLMLEDFIPSGTEILNKNLLTSQTAQEPPVDQNYNPESLFQDGWGWWYFNQSQIYDDHILWTADYVPAGRYVLTYNLVPYQRGDFQVLPAHAWMYFYPEVQGTSEGNLFIIE